MPPKAKFTRNEIVDTAYELVREQGAEALTAREVAKGLGTSPSPIFALFRDMEELKTAVKERAPRLLRQLYGRRGAISSRL